MNFLRFVAVCWKAWKKINKGHQTIYVAVVKRGVPNVALFVGVGREAWRVTQFAIEAKRVKF